MVYRISDGDFVRLEEPLSGDGARDKQPGNQKSPDRETYLYGSDNGTSWLFPSFLPRTALNVRESPGMR